MAFDPSAAARPDSGVFGLSHSEDEARVVLLPVPFEATASYHGGTSRGPEAILKASRQVDLFDVETGRPYLSGIHLLPSPRVVADADTRARDAAGKVHAAGGAREDRPDLLAAIALVNAASNEVNRFVEGEVDRLIGAGKKVGVVGGEHAVSFGSIAAHARAFPGLGVLHLDAHADLRRAYEGFEHSHASVFYNVMEEQPAVARLVQVGLRDVCEEEVRYAEASSGRIVPYHDALLASQRFEGETFGSQVRRIVAELPREVYLSFDIDALEPALCPHTGTPVPGGLTFQQAVGLVRGVVSSGRRIVGFDLVEVSPGEGPVSIDGDVGARLLYKIIGFMLK